MAIVSLGAVVLLGTAGYRAAESTLTGLAASAAAVNEVAAWVAGIIAVIAVVTAAGWLLLARYRRVRDAPIEAAFHAQVQAALIAREQGTRKSVDGGPVAAAAPALLRGEAVRCDRLGPGQQR